MSRPALCIILARAGSKGVPGKNARPIAGRPCIAWTIAHAQSSRNVGPIIVSTDGDELARISRDAGTIVTPRPAPLASDTATVDDAARDALAQYEASTTPLADDAPIVLLYANVPIRPPTLTDDAVELLTRTRCDSVQSYARVGKHHPWWTVRVDDASGHVRPWEGDVLYHNVFRRQDLPPAFVPDGGVVALTRRALLRHVPGASPGPHQFLGVDRRAVITREGEVVDIDSPIDLYVAEAMLRDAIAAQAHDARPSISGGAH
ncbi:MAG: acylneuraminate cytidylyltransferase family protein [Phycisphaerales bacterium]|jgi:CMP-N-acetylneuraminic acid synthetase|nr:acylneuraminate cytidylyltransferase family protein [Phycisphaerales bacterium]